MSLCRQHVSSQQQPTHSIANLLIHTTLMPDLDTYLAEAWLLRALCACQSDDVTWSWWTWLFVVPEPHSGISLFIFFSLFGPPWPHPLTFFQRYSYRHPCRPPSKHTHVVLGMCTVSCIQEMERAAETIERHLNCSQEPHCRRSSGT